MHSPLATACAAYAAPARGARSVCRASRTLRATRCAAPRVQGGVCGVCGATARAAGRWSRVVASGSGIPTGVTRAGWTVRPEHGDAARHGADRGGTRRYAEPVATSAVAARAMRRSVADRAELRRDCSPADIADAAVSVTAAVHGPSRLSRHTGGSAPGTPRALHMVCPRCGGVCAAVIRPGAACPRKGVTRR